MIIFTGAKYTDLALKTVTNSLEKNIHKQERHFNESLKK